MTLTTHEDFVQDHIDILAKTYMADAKQGDAFFNFTPEDLYEASVEFRSFCTETWKDACDVYQSDCESRENFYYH